MSPTEGLTPAEIEELRGLLEKARVELEEGLSASAQDAKPVDLGLSIGRLSRVDALQQQHMAIARRMRVTVQLQQIRAAQERLASGSYGLCIECGEDIGYARLRVRPEAPLCRVCQSGRRS